MVHSWNDGYAGCNMLVINFVIGAGAFVISFLGVLWNDATCMSTELSMMNLQTSILVFTDSTGGLNIVKLLFPVFQCLYFSKGSNFCELCLGLSIHVASDT